MLRFDRFSRQQALQIRHRTVADTDAIQRPFVFCGGIPKPYERVMSEIGPCEIKGAEEPENFPAHLVILPGPISAISDYFRDQQILKLGAKADVLLVATDSTGHGYGYDTGDRLRFVTVDNYRIVDAMPMPFDQWVFGTIACWPEGPVSFDAGVWLATDGRTYTQNGVAPA